MEAFRTKKIQDWEESPDGELRKKYPTREALDTFLEKTAARADKAKAAAPPGGAQEQRCVPCVHGAPIPALLWQCVVGGCKLHAR